MSENFPEGGVDDELELELEQPVPMTKRRAKDRRIKAGI